MKQLKNDFQANNFDLIRIVTAFLVLINHSLVHLQLYTPTWYTVIQQFHRVPMFFVMSGFLLSASFERNSQLKPYFRNRLMRIYPGLWACLIITIIAFTVLCGVNFKNTQTLPWILAQMAGVIYTPAFLTDFGYGSYNGSLWTIVVELQFYILLPVLYFLYKKFARNTSNKFFYILFAVAVSVAFILKTFPALGPLGKLVRYSFIPHVYIFLTGVILQRWKVWEWKIIKGKALYWAAFYLLIAYTIPRYPAVHICLMIVLAFTTISFGYSLAGCATKLLKGRDLSYGVYMYHGMLLAILVELNIVGSVLQLIFVGLTTFILAWLSYQYVESPAMKRAKALNKGLTPAPLIFPWWKLLKTSKNKNQNETVSY